MSVGQSFLNKNENIFKIIAYLFGGCKYMPYIYNIIITQKQIDMKTFAELTTGTVINYNNINQDEDYVFLGTYDDGFGIMAKFLEKSTNDIEVYPANTKIENFWTIIKEN